VGVTNTIAGVALMTIDFQRTLCRIGGGFDCEHGSAGRLVSQGAGLLEVLHEALRVSLGPSDKGSFKIGAPVFGLMGYVSIPQVQRPIPLLTLRLDMACHPVGIEKRGIKPYRGIESNEGLVQRAFLGQGGAAVVISPGVIRIHIQRFRIGEKCFVDLARSLERHPLVTMPPGLRKLLSSVRTKQLARSSCSTSCAISSAVCPWVFWFTGMPRSSKI
jgi:hypothetical protein